MPAGSGITSGEGPGCPSEPSAQSLPPSSSQPDSGLLLLCRELSQEPHLATSPQDEKLVQLLLQRWRDPESGLDAAEAPQYQVLLSFPDQRQPNRVSVGEGPRGWVVGAGYMPVGWGSSWIRPDLKFLHSESRWSNPLLMPPERGDSNRGSGAPQCGAALCCLCSSRKPTGGSTSPLDTVLKTNASVLLESCNRHSLIAPLQAGLRGGGHWGGSGSVGGAGRPQMR